MARPIRLAVQDIVDLGCAVTMGGVWCKLGYMCVVFVVAACLAGGVSCEPVVGIVSPDRITSRGLELWNRSGGYVVFRVVVPGAEPLVTAVLPPGGEFNGEMEELLGTLCPGQMTIEIFAYGRARVGESPLVDETVLADPYASAVVTLVPERDFGCRADVATLSLRETIWCDVLEVDPTAGRIGFDANGINQKQTGLNADEAPVPRAGTSFPLVGRAVDLEGRPMADVEIRLADLGVSVRTDANGRFSVLRPVGSYLIEAVVPGVTVTPSARRFTHRDPSQMPIEFVVHAKANTKH